METDEIEPQAGGKQHEERLAERRKAIRASQQRRRRALSPASRQRERDRHNQLRRERRARKRAESEAASAATGNSDAPDGNDTLNLGRGRGRGRGRGQGRGRGRGTALAGGDGAPQAQDSGENQSESQSANANPSSGRAPSNDTAGSSTAAGAPLRTEAGLLASYAALAEPNVDTETAVGQDVFGIPANRSLHALQSVALPVPTDAARAGEQYRRRERDRMRLRWIREREAIGVFRREQSAAEKASLDEEQRERDRFIALERRNRVLRQLEGRTRPANGGPAAGSSAQHAANAQRDAQRVATELREKERAVERNERTQQDLKPFAAPQNPHIAVERRKNETDRMRCARERETPQEHRSRNAEDRQRKRQARNEESDEQTRQRRILDKRRARATSRVYDADRAKFLAQHPGQPFLENGQIKSYHDLGDTVKVCCHAHCKALRWVEERLTGTSMRNPKFGNCCAKGRAKLEPVQPPPPYLEDLLTRQDAVGRHFRRNIRLYNNAMSMSSVSANWVRLGPGTSDFNPTMTVQGRVYHHIGGLMPPEGVASNFLSVYMHDSSLAAQAERRRGACGGGLRQAILEQLGTMLAQHNPYVQSFLSLREWATAENEPTPYRMVIHADKRPKREHVRRYNGPEASEIAALIPGPENGLIGRRDIVLQRRGHSNESNGERLSTVAWDHRSYDPLSYVLLFPNGRGGWSREMFLSPIPDSDAGLGNVPATGETDAAQPAHNGEEQTEVVEHPMEEYGIQPVVPPVTSPATEDDVGTNGMDQTESRETEDPECHGNEENDLREWQDEDEEAAFGNGGRRRANNRRNMTPKAFYSALLFERENVLFNPLQYACRLSQQFWIDQYVKMEGHRLQYLLQNQEKLRAEDYTVLRGLLGDCAGLQDELKSLRAGRLFVLPSTFIGGDRYMRNALHDMLAVTTQVGHPDIFVTMTCNPTWPEITRKLKPGQTAAERPEVCARVFRMKSKAMMQQVIDEEIFGKVVAHVQVIEFQKRGLPHAHCIFILDRKSKEKLKTPENVDKIISAEIPPESDPELRDVVLRNQIHNPCGDKNPHAVCMGVRGKKKRRTDRGTADHAGRGKASRVQRGARREGGSGRGRGDARVRERGQGREAKLLGHNDGSPASVGENDTAGREGEEECLKFFPRPFRNETGSAQSYHYISYRRRSPTDGGETADRLCRVRNNRVENTVDNSWVIPYNAILSRMYNCHMNAEICISRIGSVTYLFKYISKRTARVTVELAPDNAENPTQTINEIEQYIDARYISASEAVWRLLGFTYIERQPPVVRLDVHLPGHHVVYFTEGEMGKAADCRNDRTKLLQWFTANEKYRHCKGTSNLTYLDFAKCFSWQNGMWKPRKKFKLSRAQLTPAQSRGGPDDAPEYDFTREMPLVVSRIFTVSPREGERFYLRTLLFHVKGATRFEDVRTVDGEVMGSFREACIARGLLTDDTQWTRALQNACSLQVVPLTEVFATILAFCEPSDPCSMLREFRMHFINDIRRRFQRREELRSHVDAEKYVLREIEHYLQSMVGKTAAGFGLPPVDPSGKLLIQRGSAAEDARTAEQSRQELASDVEKFNEGQRQVFNAVVGNLVPGVTASSIRNGNVSRTNAVPSPAAQSLNPVRTQGRLFFLDAPGGTGKTFTVRAIQQCLELNNKNVTSVATTAVAAQLLKNGRTAHAAFKIPIPCDAESVCRVNVGSSVATSLKGIDLLIWDEIAMCSRHCIEAVERTMRDVMNNNLPFGGKTVLVSGDFRQILPVVRGGSRSEIVEQCFKSSILYDQFNVLHLTENTRLNALREDPNADQEALKFPEFLLKVGVKSSLVSTDPVGRISLPQSIHRSDNIHSLCRRVFRGIGVRYGDTEWIANRAIITTKNSYLGEINTLVGAMIPGELRVFKSHDYVEAEDGQHVFSSEGEGEAFERAESSSHHERHFNAHDRSTITENEDENQRTRVETKQKGEIELDTEDGLFTDEIVEHCQTTHDFNPTGAAAELAYPVELLNSLTAGSALPDHELKLKKNYPVMLLRNINIEDGHVNGARYQVKHMTNNVLILKSIMGAHAGKYLILPRIPCGSGDESFPIKGFRRVQFPVRVCFGLSVNKSQGASFAGELGLDLRDDCFTHGQLYVALSRATHPGKLSVLTRHAGAMTMNVVYPEALR